MASIDVLTPVHDVPTPARLALASRGELPSAIHLALIDNGKPRAREILELMADELRERLPIAEIEIVAKPTAAFPITAAQAAEIAGRAHLALAALGDCGACSACSLHDAVQLERLGVPATVIITDVFPRTVAAFARTLGAEGYRPVVLPHPVASRTSERLRRLVHEVAPTAYDLLTTPVRTREPASV